MIVSMGVIGLYVGKVFEQVKGRPLFLIDREVVDGTEIEAFRQVTDDVAAERLVFEGARQPVTAAGHHSSQPPQMSARDDHGRG